MTSMLEYLDLLVEKKATNEKSVFVEPERLKLPPLKSKAGDRGLYKKMAAIIKKSVSDVEYTEDGLVKVTYLQLDKALDLLDRQPSGRGMGYSAIIYGEAGIGKSAIVAGRGKKMAAALGREFIGLDAYLAKFQTVGEFVDNFKDYYIFIDKRALAFDPTMMTGIPDPTSPERNGYLKELPLPWVSAMTTSKDAAGMLFLDEVNQASLEVQNSLFSLTNFEERTIAGTYDIKGDWRIHCAGNWGDGYSIIPLVPALKERLAPIYLSLDFRGWQAWANKTKNVNNNPIIHPLLMDFIEDDPEVNFYKRPGFDMDPNKKQNPRNLVALSGDMYTLLGDSDIEEADIDPDLWRQLISQASIHCDREFANNFKQFLYVNSYINPEDILRDPRILIDVDSSEQSEGIVTQNITVFKRNLKHQVIKFDTKFNSAKTDEEKADIVNEALYYVDALNYVFTLSRSTAASIFTIVTNQNTLPDLQIFRSLIISHLEEKGDEESLKQAEFLINLIKAIADEVRNNVGAFKATDVTAFIRTFSEDEEGYVDLSGIKDFSAAEDEERYVDPGVIKTIDQALGQFNINVRMGKIPEYV